MPLTYVTYAYVEPGGPVPTFTQPAVDDLLTAYLDQHVAALLDRVKSRTTPPATFLSGPATDRFVTLRSGSFAAFLATAQELGLRLHREMDQRTKRGFFVAVRRDTAAGPEAAVLKLDVSDKAGAALRVVGSGQPDLTALKDLLDTPGELQKGAVTPDPRLNSDVVIGEQFPDTSQYFLRALEIGQSYSSAQSVREVIKAVASIAPARVPQVFEELERTPVVSHEDFFAQRPHLLPAPEVADVLGRLGQLKRSLQPLDPTSVPIRRTIVADGIKITGRPKELADKLRVTPLPNNQWRITIDVHSEPRDET